MKSCFFILLWFFMLAHFTRGQILDTTNNENITKNKSKSKVLTPYTYDEKKEKSNDQNFELDAMEKKNEEKESESHSNNITKKKLPELLGNSFENEKDNPLFSFGRRIKRKPITYPVTNVLNFSVISPLSPERRNSYLSIAERRKYYNKTNKIVSSPSFRVIQSNEVLNYKKSPDKNLFRISEDNKSNQPNQEMNFLNFTISENSKKYHNIRQSVIQSQLEFGQKLNVKKTNLVHVRQENEDDRIKRNEEKYKGDHNVANRSNEIKQYYPTQSTKLIQITNNISVATLAPEPNLNDHTVKDLKSKRNLTRNSSYGNRLTNKSSILVQSVYDIGNNHVTTNNDEMKILKNFEAVKFSPLPLNSQNFVTKRKTEDNEKITTQKESVNESAQNITLEINSSSKNNLRLKVNDRSTLYFTHKSNRVLPNNFSQLSNNDRILLPLNTQIKARNQRNETKMNFTSEERNADFLADKFNESVSGSSVVKEETASQEDHILQTTSSSPQHSTINSIVPMTIEPNENNKRFLNEMLNNLKTTESSNSKNLDISNMKPVDVLPFTESIEVSTMQINTFYTSVETTTSEDDLLLSMDNYLEEDRKAMETKYNAKFYIFPNVSRDKQRVFKIIENEDDDEEEDANGISVVTQPTGLAIYLLAAFGIVPLLLAVAFASRFLMHRIQKQDDCESDEKLEDISGNLCEMKQNKTKTKTDLKKTPSNATTSTIVTISKLPRVQHRDSFEKQGSKNWEIPRSKLKMKTILGQGNFGQVWKAEIEDISGCDKKTKLVAVKAVKEGATEKEHKEFKKELEIMQLIGSHPNIVALLGCCTDQEPNYLIMEFVEKGKLLTYLREHRINKNYYNFSNDTDVLTSKDLLVFSYYISRGMEYLASKGIIHRDLAARNVLVDYNKVCKVADFGMSRSVRNFEDGQVYEDRKNKGALPIRWMAPESLMYSLFTQKSDVWSFGIVMWEVVTLGSTPYPNMNAREIIRRVGNGYRLERPSHCPAELYEFISNCWFHEPSKRPDFTKLRHDLSDFLEDPLKHGSFVDLDRFAKEHSIHAPLRPCDFKLIENNELKRLNRTENREIEDWLEEVKKTKMKKNISNGKGTVTLTGQGSFTINSRIFEKTFRLK